MFVNRVHVDPASMFFCASSSQPSQRSASHEPLQTEPQGPGAPLSLPPLRSSHATAAAALANQNTTTMTRKSQRLTAAAAGLLLTASHHHGSYLPGHAQPPTDIFSHVWCESDQNDGGGSVIPALFLSPLSHQSLLPPLRLLT